VKGVRHPRTAPVLAVLFTLGIFALVLAVRWRAHYSNVDDYLYALQTRAYLDAIGLDPVPLVDAWKTYSSNSPLIPMLALPIAAVDDSPDALVLVQVVPLFVLLLSIRSLLGSLGLATSPAWLGAALITTLPPVLGYAAMYHFGLAATACVVAAAAAYARSDHLRRRAPALLAGTAIGLLALSRVLSPVYVAALVTVIAIDVLSVRGDHGDTRMRNGGLAALIAIAIAAPWWLTAGPGAIRYLTSAGYPDGVSRLDAATHRLTWTATETGWLLTAVVLVLVVWAASRMLRREPGWRLAAFLTGIAALGMALLATSDNSGTGFALPFFVLACCVAAWGMARVSSRWRVAVLTVTLASLVLPTLALLDLAGTARIAGRPLWLVATPGIQEARAALGCRCSPPDSGKLAEQVMQVVGDHPLLVVRNDALVNPQSLRFAAGRAGLTAAITPPPADGIVTGRQLSAVRYVLVGFSPAPYLHVNGPELLRRLSDLRARPVLSLQLSAINTVLLLAVEPK
jgi:hypothetical protein